MERRQAIAQTTKTFAPAGLREHALRCTLLLCCLTATVSQVAGVEFLDKHFAVDVQPDIVYGMGAIGNPASGEMDLHLDLYQPVAPPQNRPAVLLLHGGAFFDGDKSDFSDLALEYASRGYVAASMQYRWQRDDPTSEPGPTEIDFFNAAVSDATKAVEWLHENSDTFGIDPSRIAIGGFSSGAVAAMFHGFQELGSDTEVAAILNFADGLYGDENLIDADDPPLFIVHGTDDPFVSPNLIRDIVDRSTEVGHPFEFHPIAGGSHSRFLETNLGGRSVLQASVDFTFEHLTLADLSLGPRGEVVDLIGTGEQWSFFRGSEEPTPFPDVAWTTPEFDVAGWEIGREGFGFGPGSEDREIATPLDDMKSEYATLYLRHSFEIDDPDVVSVLALDLDYDDAFVAYVNGVEVARSSFGESGVPAEFDVRPRTTRDGSLPARTIIDLRNFPDLLRTGKENVLAIQGINTRRADRDFVLSQIELSAALPIIGDADANNRVDFADFTILANNFGMPGGWSDGDFDGDGKVLFADFLLLADSFGPSTSQATAVPEPRSFAIALVSLLGLTALRRNRNWHQDFPLKHR